MLEKFYTSDFDNKMFIKNSKEKITFGEFKVLVLNNIERIKNHKQNVVISGDEILPFIVNLFASIFAKKDIYLVDEILKIHNFGFDYDILSDFEKKYSEKNNLNFPKVREEDIFVNLLTSGSSGIPKVIKNTLKKLSDEAQGNIDSIGFKETSCNVVTTTTPSHRYGLTYVVLIPILKNYTIISDKLFFPDDLKTQNCILVSTPSFLDVLRNHNIKFPVKPYCVFSAGAKLNRETFEYLEKDMKIVDIYGCSETGVISFKTSSDESELNLLNDVNITPCDEGTIIHTPYAIEKDVKINDIIESKPSHRMVLKNRTDRLLKIQEKRVSAQSVEDFLKLHDFVSDAFCFKKDDKIACLCALSKSGKDFLLRNSLNELKKILKQHSRKQLEIIPQKWKFIDELPVTKRGKIDSNFIEHIFSINFSFPVILDRVQGEDKIIFKLYFYPNSNFYLGHFPSYPVTPGVVQLYLASFLGSKCFSCELSDGQMKRIKFSNIIKAGEIVELELIKSGNNVSYEYRNSERTFSTGVLSCENILAEV